MKDPMSTPVIRVEWTRADGTKLEREWSINDGPPRPFDPPSFITNPSRAWDHPQDPITLRGTILAGHEDEAAAYLAVLR